MTNPVIPVEAVEAAAKAAFEYGHLLLWAEEPDTSKAFYREQARAALEAAAPHIAAYGWEQGLAYALPGTDEGLATFEELRTNNPYQAGPES